MPSPALPEQLAFLRRSLVLWPRLTAQPVAAGRMTPAEQTHGLACLLALTARLEELTQEAGLGTCAATFVHRISEGEKELTVATNYVLLLGTIGPFGITHGFHPNHGQLATFLLWVQQGEQPVWGAPQCVEIPCELHGALAAAYADLLPGALVLLAGGLDMRDEDLGADTGRLVVVGTALTVVQAGEET